MDKPTVVSREAWLKARTALLAEEKAFTQARDALSAARRKLPWVKVEKKYLFDGPKGRESLADLFDGRGQLLVYHFMFAPEWNDGCKSCSFWMDNFDDTVIHLNHRDVSFAAVSRAPLEKLEAFKRRMGWHFNWLSSGESDFNYDFNVSFSEADKAKGEVTYNYAKRGYMITDMPGLSVFAKDEAGAVYHTYSCFSRGLDMLNTAYNLLDLVPKGRDEAGLPFPMTWVRLHDKYGT